jgi:hypothetical protein
MPLRPVQSGTNISFPKDLSSSTQGHLIKIMAMDRGGNSPLGSVSLFMPGASSGSNLIFASRHEYAETKLSKVLMAGAEAAVGVGLWGPAQTIGAGLAGTTINPKVEVLYRDTDLRTFDFSFIMAPTSSEESQALIDCAQLLRYYSSPESILNTDVSDDPRSTYIGGGGQAGYLIGGNFFFTPNEFIIDFYRIEDGIPTVNANIPKIGRCVLEAVELMYNPNGEWSTFKDGNPTSAQLALRFRETRVIDRKNINVGY